MAIKLPQVSKNVLLNKAVWTGAIMTALGLTGIGAIGLANLSLGVNVFTSSAFIVTLIAGYAVGFAHDAFLTSSKKVYHTQNLFGAFAAALFLPMVLSILGVTGIATTSNIASYATVALFGAFSVLGYVGYEVARRLRV